MKERHVLCLRRRTGICEVPETGIECADMRGRKGKEKERET